MAKRVSAVGYLRTSSRTNVGEGKDSEPRQRAAIEDFAKAGGFEVVEWFSDAGTRGSDDLGSRKGFAEMLTWCREHNVSAIIVENATRFARDLIVQETGYAMLKREGFTLVASDDPDAFTSDTPTAVLIRQILGAVSQFEKAALVAKLRGARDRASEASLKARGKRIEGRKGYAEKKPELVREAKRLARKSPLTGKAKTLAQIAAELAAKGHVTARGNPFSPSQIQRLIGTRPTNVAQCDVTVSKLHGL